MDIWVQYGKACSFDLPAIKAGSTDFAASSDYTPVSGDAIITKDGGTPANITTLPSFISGINTMKWDLSAAETTCKRATIVLADAPTKAVADNQINIRTFGHPSADDPRSVVYRGTATAGSTSSFTMPSGGGISALDDAYNGCFWRCVEGTGAGIAFGQVVDYVGTTRVFTIYAAGPPVQGRPSPTALDNTSVIEVLAYPVTPAAVAIDALGRLDIGKINGTTIVGNGVSPKFGV